MKEILITSSVLIAALLLLRQVFRKTISRRLQYALWALVLVRLLVPVNLPALDHNVLTAADPVVRDIEALYITPRQIAYDTPSGAKIYGPPDTPAVAVGPATPDNKLTFSVEDAFHTPVEATTLYQWQIVLEDLLRPVWYAGMAAMAVWFLLSNLLFWRKLRRRRTPYAAESCARRVYLVEEGLPSPCLFGLFHPAVYLTPAAAASPETLRHVLAHEETHARHLDPLWSLLRAVCLAVYWFDPLVWAAALASRSDCELACDEGAILRLGEAERIPYGKTLLSLIPVGRGPSNPLLSATTMTAGKKQLKDRVARIAQSRRTVGLALFAVIAIAAVVCAATFTGAATRAPEEADSAAPRADGPLTGEELRYFNEEFFSGEDGFNLRGQFLTCLYERPEGIDLFSLFYNGVGSPDVTDEAERRAIAGGEDPGVDLTKFTTAEADAALLEHTGLTLAQTNQVDLDTFRYFPQYDAYYLFHGDTNAVPIPDFFAGEREGDTVRLYYEEFQFGGYGVFCLTLEEREEGGYWFRSHLLSEMPSIPPVYPAGEPWMTVSLEGLTPYEPQAVEVERRGLEDIRSRWDIKVLEGYEQTLPAYTETLTYKSAIIVYQAVDGAIRAAVEDPDGLDCFFTFPEGVTFDYAKEHITDFDGLLGRSGVSISYNAQKDGEYFTTFNDYYTLGGDGTPCLLARAYGEDVVRRDLDGDGQMELASAGIHDVQIFFRRDGQLYEADVLPLLAERWRDPASFYPTYWDKYGRSLTLNAEVPLSDDSFPEWYGGQDTGTAVRQLYFDGENLLLYKAADRPVTNHVMAGGVSAPEEVLDAARAEVHDRYEFARIRNGVYDDDAQLRIPPAEYDDWRLEVLGGPWTELLDTQGKQRIEIWQINYEFHTTTPKRVILAGGAYLTEDAWHCNTYPGCTYLYFLFPADGPRRYLYSAMENDCAPGTEMFRTDMACRLDEMGVVPLTEVQVDVLADMILMNEASFLNNMAEREDGEEIIDRLRSSLTAKWGAPLDGLAEQHFRYGGGPGDWNHKEIREYYVEYFDANLRPKLTEGGAALWERLTDQAAAPADRLLPTLEDIRALAPAEAAEEVYQLGKANLTAYLREPALYDGWRVSHLTRETGFETFGLNLAVYSAWFELHPSRPDEVVLAGGMDFTEDGWIRGLMSTSPYLVFLTSGNHYTLLESDIPDDLSPDSPAFQAEIARVLLENQLLQPSQIDDETLLAMLGASTLNLWGTYPEEEQEAVLTALDAFHNRGPQELQMDLRDKIQTTVWTQRDLDEHGAALFQKLLDRTGIQAHGIGYAANHLGSAITNALYYWRQNASAHEYDYHEEAYYLLDTQRGGSSCTAYLLVSWGDYEVTEDGYELVTGGDWNAMAVSFAYVNDRYQATEIWEPHGGGLYEREIRACFPEEAAETVFSSSGPKYEAIRQALDDSLAMYAEAGYKAYLERQADQ